jgi:hypothetical protein
MMGVNVSISVYAADGTTLVGGDGPASSASGTLSVVVPGVGPYFILVSYGSGPPTMTIEMTASIYSLNSTLSFGGVRAVWDNGGGDAYEACP